MTSRNKENKGLPSRWRLKHGAYYYRVPVGSEIYWDNKKEFRLGKTLSESHLAYAERLQLFDSNNLLTMMNLADRYQVQVVSLKRPATQKSNLFSLGFIRTAFGDNAIASIQPSHIYQFRDALAEQKSKKTANLALEVLSHMFTKSIEWGARSDHPMTGKKVAKFSMAPRTRYVTDEELLAFASILPDYWQLYISLKLHLGLSKGDLLGIRLTDINNDQLFVQRNKTGKQTVYTLSPSALSIIDSIKSYSRSDVWLFATEKFNPYIKPDGNTSGFDSIWQRYMKKALDQGLVKERFTEHDLRSKVASDVSLEHAQALLQHTNAQTTKRNYRVLPDKVNSR